MTDKIPYYVHGFIRKVEKIFHPEFHRGISWFCISKIELLYLTFHMCELSWSHLDFQYKTFLTGLPAFTPFSYILFSTELPMIL